MSEPIDWKHREEIQPYRVIWKLAADNSDRIDELEQRLAEARALLERWKATVEDEVLLTEEEVSVQHDTTFFLAKK
jgi:hypothetical protein